MNKVYSRINWENYPSEATALNETNLNKMDFALNEVDNRLIEQDTTKLSRVDATNDIVDWNMDETTGIITITRRSGEQIIFDLNIEKIPVSFSLSDDGILTMVTDDGTEFTANIGAMIPVLTFNDSDEISVSVSGIGINKTYSFSIKTGSVTEDKLQPNFLADIKVESANASLSATNAKTSETNSLASATLSESYAVGGTGIRGDVEDTDNAKYYNEQAQEALSKMQSAQVTGVKGNAESEYRRGDVNIKASDIGVDTLIASSVGFVNKNLIPYPFYDKTVTRTGITWTDNGDGTITANGTATEYSQYFVIYRFVAKVNMPKGTYTISGCPSGGSNTTFYMMIGKNDNLGNWQLIATDYGSGATFKLTENSNVVGVTLRIMKGQTVSNLVFKPQLEVGEVATEFEMNHGTTLTSDVKDNIVTFTSNDAGPDGTPSLISLEKLTTGEKLSALMNKVSIIANNFRYFLKMLGNNDISALGDGTVTGGISALNDSLSNEDFIKNISTFNCTIYDSYSSAIKIGNIVVLNMLIYNTANGQSEMSGIIIKVPYAPIKNIRLSTTAKIGYTATPLPCTLDLLTDGNIKIDSCNGEPSLIGWINLSICYVCNQ